MGKFCYVYLTTIKRTAKYLMIFILLTGQNDGILDILGYIKYIHINFPLTCKWLAFISIGQCWS